MNKRPRAVSGLQRPGKRPFGVVKVKDETYSNMKHAMFRILMPNGTTIELKMREPRNEIPIEEFIAVVEKEYLTVVKLGSPEPKRKINWKYKDLHFTDAHANKITIKLNLSDFMCSEWHFLWLHDGLPEPDTYEGMWDLTPDTDLLKELPDDYTCEAALADLIDNSLQALWSNEKCDARLINVELHPEKIIIFDSGPGMDGRDGNLVKWGKMGASLHRSFRGKAIGGSPPYLLPFFGMFGYGGPVATMCLGRRAVVSSKTKECKKVFILHLEKEALITASRLENCWRTKGGMRDPSEAENKNSPHGSFTQVEIIEPKMKIDDLKHFQCKLKDIYFPYIQCDELSGKTSRPVKFQVNGEDLVGIQGGEVSTTYLHSCNGPDFTVQLHFSISRDPMQSQTTRVFLEANARLKFVYFPIIKGEERIQSIIDCLDAEGYSVGESYETFSRVSIRRLGRLLPDARWASLPIMEPKQKVGEKAKIMKICCSRVKCFVDTDAGFNPTPHKTDLAQHHPYTKALKNFGSSAFENDKDVHIEISKDGNKVALSQLVKLYHDWISDMHKKYDGEIDGGLDQPTILLSPTEIKKLGLSADAARVHKKIRRREMCWHSGQKIKVLKGACAGCHKNNVYATLEYIILAGLPGDVWGEGRLICRPLGLPANRGCKLFIDKGKETIDIHESMVVPLRVIDSNTCIPVDDIEWGNKFKMHRQKLPSAIELLSDIDYRDLKVEGGMPADVLKAGDAPPENIVAVIRPEAYNSENSSKRLDQKSIVKNNTEMTLEVKFSTDNENAENLIGSTVVKPSCHMGLHGLYFFPLKSKFPNLFQKVGCYTFSFSLITFSDVRFKLVLQVQSSADVSCWKVLSPKQDVPYEVRVGSSFERLHIACCDKYGNRAKLTGVPKLAIKLVSKGIVLAPVSTMTGILSTDKSRIMIKGIVVKSGKLDDIRPNYEASFNISTLDEAFSVVFPCRVLPGTPHSITAHPVNLRKELIPGQIVEALKLEIFDEYGNHSKEGECILLSVDGFSYEDRSGVLDDEAICMKKVDDAGFVDISNILKVSKGYGKDVYLSVLSKDRVILKMNFQTEVRELQTLTKVFKNCEAGSHLENVMFEIVNSEGIVDESVNHDEKHGQSHTLTIKSKTLDTDDSVHYAFRHGRCTIRSIPLPYSEGVFSFSAAHSRYAELTLDIEVHVKYARHENQGDIGSQQDAGYPPFLPHDTCEDILFLPQTPSLKAFKSAHQLSSPQCPQGKAVQPCSSTKTLNENAVPVSHSSKTPQTPTAKALKLAHQLSSPQCPQGNAVLPRSSTKTLNKNAVPVSHSSKTSQTPISKALKSAHKLYSPQCPQGNAVPPCSSAKTVNENAVPVSHSSKKPKFENTGSQDKIFAVLPIQEMSPRDQGDLGGSRVHQKELEDDLIKYNMELTHLQEKLEMLNRKLDDLQNASELQDHDFCNGSSPCGKDIVVEKITSKSQSVAARICKSIEETPSELKPGGILGIVALLGNVESIELSRMLALYLGEDVMCAIVCNNYAAARYLETNVLRKFKTEHGKCTSPGYYTHCLEDIAPINSKPSKNPEDQLPLQLPTMPNRGIPPGFLGYAVNMINIEATHSKWRTSTGHGLRETLFYSLFGDLQVYDKRSHMIQARSCMKDGAISLDGGIMRGNGLLSFGQWESDALFPVLHTKDITRDIEIERTKLEIAEVEKSYNTAEKKFMETRGIYNRYKRQK